MVFHPTALASIKLVSWFFRPNQSLHHNTELNTDILSLAPTEAVDTTDHVALTSWSSCIASFSLKKIRALPTQNASQLLEQATLVSFIDYCNGLLTGAPLSGVKLLQMVQNVVVHLIFNH